ncbi:MAG TPA: hypothetical protein VKJ47_10540 [Candidatus Binatia bacterium]|nr:hypothetical protein [Candidatus Binatia bacterium]
MAKKDLPTPLSSPTSTPAPEEKQTQEVGLTVLFKPLLWFIVLPGGVLLLVKWLLGF